MIVQILNAIDHYFKFTTPAMVLKQTPDEIKNAYEEIGEWLNENGYDWNGPSREVCSKKPKEKDGKMILFSTIQVPIKKK